MARPKGSKNEKGRPKLKDYICSICNRKYKSYRKTIYCSYKCKGIAQSKKYKGKGNPFYGKTFKHTNEAKYKIGKAAKERPLKKKLSYIGIHAWLTREFGKADYCENKDCESKSKKFEWALKKGKTYKRDRKSFIKLCCQCHRRYDLGNNFNIRL